VDVELVRMVCSPNITPVPKGPLSGTVRVPGSKSVSNRVLPLAVMGTGNCRIRGASLSVIFEWVVEQQSMWRSRVVE
jgi:5-enolpyruvylshikimate-3-phosphate synthase